MELLCFLTVSLNGKMEKCPFVSDSCEVTKIKD